MEVQTALWQNRPIRKEGVELVQINIGDKCNQSCSHCHIGASPAGNRKMDS